MALAASVLITAGVVGGGWAFLARQRLERAALFNQALGEAERPVRGGDASRRRSRLAGSPRAMPLARSSACWPTPPTGPREGARPMLVRDVTRAAAAAENDQKLLARLVDIRSAKADDPDGSVTDADYADAFREAGIDVASLPPAEAGR